MGAWTFVTKLIGLPSSQPLPSSQVDDAQLTIYSSSEIGMSPLLYGPLEKSDLSTKSDTFWLWETHYGAIHRNQNLGKGDGQTVPHNVSVQLPVLEHN